MVFCKLFGMADDGLPSGNNNKQNENKPEPEDTDQPKQHLCLDLGDDLSRKLETNRLGNSSTMASGGSGAAEMHKREDNPFSFKHFLRSDSTNYQNKGARPKVYCENRSVSLGSDVNGHLATESKPRIVPEFSSALPDFVQDHLVIEQCYLGSNTNSNYNLDVKILPDFTPSRDNINRLNLDASHSTHKSRLESNPSDLPLPLDLPLRPQAGFPLDLPIVSSSNGSRNCPTTSEVGNSKSLPDFLADSGAVCTQKSDTLPVFRSPESESELLRHELDMVRRQLVEQTRRSESLSRELEIARNKEHDYTQNLAKALEQVESNLEKSKRRTTSAEITVMKLKAEVNSLKVQINQLKLENKNLRGEEAAGGPGYNSTTNEIHSQRLAQELRSAASTAEYSLRQLLTGVDNLRIMAATLENMHRIEEEKSDPFMDVDKDTGPAL